MRAVDEKPRVLSIIESSSWKPPLHIFISPVMICWTSDYETESYP